MGIILRNDHGEGVVVGNNGEGISGGRAGRARILMSGSMDSKHPPLSTTLPLTLIHKVTPQHAHEAEFYIEINFADGAITDVNVGRSLRANRVVGTPNRSDQGDAYRYIRSQRNREGTVTLTHLVTLQSFTLDAQELLDKLDELRHCKPNTVSLTVRSHTEVDDFMAGLDELLGPAAPLPPAHGPFGN